MKRRNKLVNIMTFQKMEQMRDEGVLPFLSRLNCQANLCDLQVNYSCQLKLHFREEFKTLQLIRDLKDNEIQEKVLAAGAALSEGNELSLAEVVKMVEVSESAKSSCDLNRLLDHQWGKMQKCQGKGKSYGTDLSKSKFGFCGRSQHDRSECQPKMPAVIHVAKGPFCSKMSPKGY